MISKFITFVILVPLAIIMVVFCVANREMVSVSFDPIGTMPQFSFAAPLFILLMGAVIVGLVLGGLGTWLTQSHYRRKSWQRKYEVERLKREAEESRERLRRMHEEREHAALSAATALPAPSTALTSAH
ncbi:lipopolysaccharide assembly protein LapA domain-containing protein [Mangrovicella endophytica]|uniref:lipopolysaccharide assembly protein LapA domain-containing protein n=1 Tax=Mangrovicella endophytica TaxID=2066697 RepID=UPI000C9E7059|nr:LapA family protein [Mangrovicella endophytica]